MGAKVQCENYFPVVFPSTKAGLDAEVYRSRIEVWPDCTGEETSEEKQLYNTLKQGTMGQCSDNDFEILKHTMLKHQEVFRDQVHELHRLYQVQKLLMAELKKKDSNTSTLTCGPVQDGPFPLHAGSEPMESEERSNFWSALGSSMTDKDGRDCRQLISGKDYMQNHRSSLFEKNLQLGLIARDDKSSRDTYNLQPSGPRKLTFDLEKPADEYVDDELANKNEKAKTLKREIKDDILQPASLNDRSTTEPESEVLLTLKTGCEQGGRKNGRQNGAFIKLGIAEISNKKLEEHKQPRHHEEALFFPATSIRSEALSQEAVGRKMPVLSNQCFSRGPFNLDQEYKRNAEWSSVPRTRSFQEQRESRYPWPEEGTYPGTVSHQKNAVFSLVSTKGLSIDPSPTSKGGSVLCASNSHKELHSTRLWRQAEDSLCHFSRRVPSQESCIQPETESQKQNFELQDKYLAQPVNTSASNLVNVKQKTSEFGMGKWYQNGNSVQHIHQQSQSNYNSGNPTIFGQSLCPTGHTTGSKTCQQQGAVPAVSACAPNSLAFPLHNLHEGSRSVWATESIALSPAQGLEGQSDVDGQIGKEVDLTLGLSSGTMEDSRKDVHYANATNKTEVAFRNNNGQFEITNRHMHQDSMHLHGEVQRGQCLARNFIARNFIELPFTDISGAKHLSAGNGLDFPELCKSSSQGLLCGIGHGMVSTKQLTDNLGEEAVLPSQKRISLVSDLVKDHDITNGDKGINSGVLHLTGKGMHKSENIFDFIDTTMKNSTHVWGTCGNSVDLRTDKNHSDKQWIVATDPPKHQMKIETFKENINAVYGPCRGEELSANSSKQTFITENMLTPSTRQNVGENLQEGTSLALGFTGSDVKGSRQLGMDDRFALNKCSKARRVSTSGKTVSLTQAISTGKINKDGEHTIKFSPQITISDINDCIEVAREGSSCTDNALFLDREKENDSQETFCCTTQTNVMTKDDAKKDAQSKETDFAETSSGTHEANALLSQHDRDLENCGRFTDVQRSSESNFESEVGTFQIKTTKGLSSSCPNNNIENKMIGKSASRDSSINRDAANCLLKIASEKSSDRLGTDSLEFILAPGVKSSLDWLADTVVSNADVSVFTSIGHQEEADNPVSSSRSGNKAKQSEISEDSVPQENSCSPHDSNGLDFFESMTLMLEECIVDLDCKAYVSQEKESEKPPSPMNSTLKPSKRGKRRRDFQREILPSISSLSRQEVTEDMQIIGGLIRSTGDDWHTGSTRRSSGKFSMTDDWFLPLTRRRSRNVSGSRENDGSMKKNNDCQATKLCDQEVERLNTLSWTSSWGDTIRRRRMKRPRVSVPSLALSPA